jgi:hypothetical protein
MPEKSNGFGRVWTRELGFQKKSGKCAPVVRKILTFPVFLFIKFQKWKLCDLPMTWIHCVSWERMKCCSS